jgi:hypothetical protein
MGIRSLHQAAMIFKWIWNNYYAPIFKYPSDLRINGNYLDDKVFEPELVESDDLFGMSSRKMFVSQIYYWDKSYVRRRNTKEKLINWNEKAAEGVQISKCNYLVYELVWPKMEEYSKMWTEKEYLKIKNNFMEQKNTFLYMMSEEEARGICLYKICSWLVNR